MLSDYLHAAMQHARYEILAEEQTYYGEIAECAGVYADAASLEQCREELAQVLEDWILFRVHKGLELPEINGLRLEIRKEEINA